MSPQELASTLDLAIDFTTTMDCQRYNQFEGMNLHAVHFVPVLEQSLKWRELFSLPQVPPLVLPSLREAFAEIEWPADSDNLRFYVKKLIVESERLIDGSKSADIVSISRSIARQRFPQLWRHSRAAPGTANVGYLDPFEPKKRNHDRIVFFETRGDDVFILPRSMTTSAAVNTVFELIWSYRLTGTNRFIGDIFERVIAVALRARCNSVYENVHYSTGRTNYEIDVAARVGNHVLLVEAKAKMLTSKSRTADMIAFLRDYTDSYLKLLKQLTLHNRSLIEGVDTSDERRGRYIGPSSDQDCCIAAVVWSLK